MNFAYLVRKFTKNENNELEFADDERMFSSYDSATAYIQEKSNKHFAIPSTISICAFYESKLFGEYELRIYNVKKTWDF